jgi:aminoglycoside phosphotransferase family enzyme
VLNFVVDMITYNYIKQNEMSKNELNDTEASKSNSLNKLVKLTEAVNKSAYTKDGHIDISQIRAEIWQQNVITLACYFPQALSMIGQDVQEAIFKD